jgi:dTDP-glucose 4,6-dehydratase
MNILVTGGAGFIGRWVVKKLLDEHEVIALDNLSNGSLRNIKEFKDNPKFKFIKGDILDAKLINRTFEDVELCLHLAAQINVQESLDNPEMTFTNNVVGTYNVLEACRKNDARLLLTGTCMVYDTASSMPINEEHPINPKSPYAGSKIAAEELAISYHHGYGLPVVIVRPFNTYGPFQKSNMEGGVVSIFIRRFLEGKPLVVYGDGNQTRDLLYVEDCADFIVSAAFCKKAVGEIINAGTGKDIRIKDLALMVCKDERQIIHVPHHHQQSEIPKLICDYTKAKRLLGWEPKISLRDGIKKTMKWMKNSC